jgi:radical SAM-linked protein
MVCAKVRIRFCKTGDLRLISHHDLMRCFERMLRRAALPYRCTEGFNPKPRLVFPSPLPLGVIGCQEVADLELDAELAAEEVRERLVRQAVAGLDILEVERIDGRKTVHARLACYRVSLPPDPCSDLPRRIAALLSSPACWVERQRPHRRKLDVRPYVQDIRLVPEALEMDLVITPSGTARPEEILNFLGLGDLLEQGSAIERTSLELDDEPAPASRAASLAALT